MEPRVNILLRLTEEDFEAALPVTSNPAIVYRALKDTREVQELVLALQGRQVHEDAFFGFVLGLCCRVEEGKLFDYDTAVAAVAVVLECHGSPLAREFVDKLAELHLAEAPQATSIARECVRSRVGL